MLEAVPAVLTGTSQQSTLQKGRQDPLVCSQLNLHRDEYQQVQVIQSKSCMDTEINKKHIELHILEINRLNIKVFLKNRKEIRQSKKREEMLFRLKDTAHDSMFPNYLSTLGSCKNKGFLQSLKINVLQPLMSITKKYFCLSANTCLAGSSAVIFPKYWIL